LERTKTPSSLSHDLKEQEKKGKILLSVRRREASFFGLAISFMERKRGEAAALPPGCKGERNPQNNGRKKLILIEKSLYNQRKGQDPLRRKEDYQLNP